MSSQEMTAEETRLRNVAVMGEQVGSIYSELWQELAWLYRNWTEYVVLFGTKESRVSLLNRAAPAFTRIVQDALWEGVILNIARLTDSAKSMGKQNLSIRALEDAVTDSVLKPKVSAAVKQALVVSEFCRDWRNRRIAHRDLELALRRGAEPLRSASRLGVDEALKALVDVLNVLARHYFDSTTLFDLDLRVGGRPDGAMSLLYLVEAGFEAEAKRQARLNSGDFDPSDYRASDL